MRPKVLLALRSDLYRTMFSDRDRRRLFELADILNPSPPPEIDTAFLCENLERANVAITSWHTPAFDAGVVNAAPDLRLVCHAGGSVRPIVSARFWEHDVRITSAASAIAEGVAEYCLGLILIGSKRAFWLGQETARGHWKDAGGLYGGWHEIYQQTVGIVGAGFVGRRLISHLQSFHCDILVYDPYVSEELLKPWRVTRAASLDELFERSSVVSLNVALTPETNGMIRGSHLKRLRPGALFINTSRGQVVNETELVEALAGGSFAACIDVTSVEPPPLDHPLRHLPNVWLTPHLAGAVAENQFRIGTLVVDELQRFIAGSPLQFEVTRDSLSNLA